MYDPLQTDHLHRGMVPQGLRSDLQEQLLQQLLQFVTGSARVPVGGFRELVPWKKAQRLKEGKSRARKGE